jgi:hypothetical protein
MYTIATTPICVTRNTIFGDHSEQRRWLRDCPEESGSWDRIDGSWASLNTKEVRPILLPHVAGGPQSLAFIVNAFEESCAIKILWSVYAALHEGK